MQNAAYYIATICMAGSVVIRCRGFQLLLLWLQAINSSCYLIANTIILYGHCKWFSAPVFWMAFLRWQVRLPPVLHSKERCAFSRRLHEGQGLGVNLGTVVCSAGGPHL